MAETRPGPPAPDRMPTRRPVAFAAAALAVLATWFTVTAAGAPGAPAGLSAPDSPMTAWLVPGLRVLSDLAAVTTVGFLLGAAVLLPGDRLLSAAGYRWMRSAGWSASGWCLLALATVPAVVAEFLGRGLTEISAGSMVDVIGASPQAQAQLVVAVVTALVALAARVSLTTGTALVLLLLASAAALPPALTGHAGSTGGLVAPTAVALHVVGVVLWAGGLVALLLCRRIGVTAVAVAVSRFSRLAGVLVVVVGVSGLLMAFTQLSTPARAFDTGYGLLVLVKGTAFAGLVLVGTWHRRRTVPLLAAGRPAAFRRLLGVEILLFGSTIGVAVGLSRTPSPVAGSAPAADGVGALLGSPATVPLFPGAFLTPSPDLFFAALAAAAVGWYVFALRRMAGQGRRWPPLRSLAWFAGWAVVLLATNTGAARYAQVLVSVFVAQQLAVALVAPLLLVLARPGVLAMAVLRPATEQGVRGPREWLVAVQRQPVVRWLTHPWGALAIFLIAAYALYVADLPELVLRSRLAGAVLLALSLVGGALFFRSLLGAVEENQEWPLGVRMSALAGWAAGHLAVALVVLRGGTLLAAGWWSGLRRLWGPLPMEDQQLAGRIAATVGVAVLGAAVLTMLRPRGRPRVEAGAAAVISGDLDEDSDPVGLPAHRTVHRASR